MSLLQSQSWSSYWSSKAPEKLILTFLKNLDIFKYFKVYWVFICFLHAEKVQMIYILQKPAALCTKLGGLKHFIRVWFHFCGADVLSTNYFLQITCSLSLLASAFSRQHTVNGAERCKQEHLGNLVIMAGPWILCFSVRHWSFLPTWEKHLWGKYFTLL